MIGNKNGAIGQFITGFVSFIILAILVGGFIIASGVLAKTHGAGKTRESDLLFTTGSNNIFLDSLEASVKEKVNGQTQIKKKKMLITDAIVYDALDKAENVYPDLEAYLKQIVNENKGCMVFGTEGGKTYFKAYYKYDEKGIKEIKESSIGEQVASQSAGGSVHRVFNAYANKGLLSKASVSFNDIKGKKTIYISSYYGPCIEEAENVK